MLMKIYKASDWLYVHHMADVSWLNNCVFWKKFAMRLKKNPKTTPMYLKLIFNLSLIIL